MITKDFKERVRLAILEDRKKYPDFSDKRYATSIGLSASIYSLLKKGKVEGVLSDGRCISQARRLKLTSKKKAKKIARTSVYVELEEQILFCKNYSKGTILIDECEIGKTTCAEHIALKLKNVFFIDCSQAKTKSLFTRELAKTLGLESGGRLHEIRKDIKFYLNMLIEEPPCIILDDGGYLDFNVFIDIIEYWNGTKGNCGWLMIGDDSLQKKLQRGLDSKKIGVAALFSRFSGEFVHYVPKPPQDRLKYLKKLISDVAGLYVGDKYKINKLATQCLAKDGILRHLETLLDLNEEFNSKQANA